MRIRKDDLFGETFACGADNLSLVSFMVSGDAEILFMPFDRVMRSCTMACVFHHRLIAGKNRELMRKAEVVSKRTSPASLEAGPLIDNINGGIKVMTGFVRNTVMGVAGTVIDAVKA